VTRTVPARMVSLRATAALATVTVLSVAACSAKHTATAPAPTSAAPSVSAPASESTAAAQAEQQILAAYHNYREAYIAAAAVPDPTGGTLRDYAGGTLLSLIKADLQSKVDEGYVMTGRPTWSVKVVTVNVTKAPYTAETEECFDSTNWKLVAQKTGKSVAAAGQNLKYLVTGKAERYDDGKWRIIDNQAQRDRPC
jgi:hypothetical protein